MKTIRAFLSKGAKVPILIPFAQSAYPGLLMLILLSGSVHAQIDSLLKNERFSMHYQATVINQYKPAFNAPYSGENSLLTGEENKSSTTSTVYSGMRLWRGASVFFNPEIAGGSGLSSVLGIAAAPNGETFRIGSPVAKLYVARAFFRQEFALTKSFENQESDLNQIQGRVPLKHISVIVGKISMADYFDNNMYSHDPRTQFMSWGLMSNGAWDYPANTRGYTPSTVIAYVSPEDELRYAISLMPVVANGNIMNWNIAKSSSQTLEYTHHYALKGKPGAIRVLAFYTIGRMGNYRESVRENAVSPDITAVRKYGHDKFGFAVNAEQKTGKYSGAFIRAGWNDGRNETWAFTEIDRSLSGGLVFDGSRWKRNHDQLGAAVVFSGISRPHRDYLSAGGKGFMLGDGQLNYALEQLGEIYYSAKLSQDHMYLSGTYQVLLNPGYNRDRKGPVQVLSVRLHVMI